MAKQTKKPEPFSFSALHIDTALLEVKFHHRNYYSGLIPLFWERFDDLLEETSLKDYETKELPGDEPGTLVQVGKRIVVSADNGRITVSETLPNDSLKDFFAVSRCLYQASRDILDIVSLNRTGFRVIFVKLFDNPAEVVRQLFELPYLTTPHGLSMQESGKPLMPHFGFGWNDDEKSIVYRVSGASETLEFDLPIRMAVQGDWKGPFRKTFNKLIFDVDVYIPRRIEAQEMILDEWLGQAFAVVREDGEKFFG